MNVLSIAADTLWIIALSIIMFLQSFVEIPEVVTGLGGAALIGVSLWSSIRWNRVFGREDAQTGPDSLHDAAPAPMPADQLGQQSRA